MDPATTGVDVRLDAEPNRSTMAFVLVSYGVLCCCECTDRIGRWDTAAFVEGCCVPRHRMWCLRVVVLIGGAILYASLAQKLDAAGVGFGRRRGGECM